MQNASSPGGRFRSNNPIRAEAASTLIKNRLAGGAWVAVVRVATCLALSSVVACAGLNKKATAPDMKAWPEIRPDLHVEALRLRMHEYSTTFAAQVDLAASAIERQAEDPAVRRNAMLWKVRAIPEMRKACFRLEAVGALVDAWILVRQMEQLFSVGTGAAAFGPLQAQAVEVSRRSVEQVREIGASIAVSPATRDEFERKFVEPWIAEHPLQDMSFVRESPIARFAEQSRAAGDALQSVGTIEDLAVSLSQQLRIYLADMPRQVRGEVDLMRTDMLPEERVASMEGDLHTSAAAADRLASSVEGMPDVVLNERRIVLDEVSRQRGLVMEALTIEEQRAVAAVAATLAAERGELLRSIETQRLATLEWATAERRATIAEAHREVAGSIDALRGERAIATDELRRIIDLELLRIALFLAAAVVLAPLVAHAYARVWPRRWHDPPTHSRRASDATVRGS